MHTEKNAQAIKKFPEYQSHKVVRGARIMDIIPDGDLICLVLDVLPNKKLLPEEGMSGAYYWVTDQFILQHKVETGKWLVIYEDGYASISPDEAWQGGYKIMPEYDRSIDPSCEIQPGIPRKNLEAILRMSETMSTVRRAVNWQETIKADLLAIKNFVANLDREIKENMPTGLVSLHYNEYKTRRIDQFINEIIRNPSVVVEVQDEPGTV